MTAQTATIADFLLARIAEDEAQANRRFKDWRSEGGMLDLVHTLGPARVLAEVEAKRRIVRQLDLFLQGDEQDPVGADEILLALAQPYADHPDFRPEWRA